jgi:nitrite reductase/ring-hydroxylating ferredoxin subunit
MTTDHASQGYVQAGTLDELRVKGRLVIRGRHRPVLVIHDRDRVTALDNRCPHMGFPLDKGAIEDGILTCPWHHARFAVSSGCTFDLWADDVPTCPVEVRDGAVWVRPTFGHPDPAGHYRRRLDDGMAHDLGLVVAKAVAGLLAASTPPRDVVRQAALFAARNRDGWGVGPTVLAALGNLLPCLRDEETALALFHGCRRVAADCDGQAPRRDRAPLASVPDPGTLERWFRRWVGVRHRDGAERTLLTAIEAGASPARLAAMLLAAATDRVFADGGHSLDFVNKALECLDLIGWEHARAVLPTVVRQMVEARGADETSAWRQPVDLIGLLEAASAMLPPLFAERRANGAWDGHAALTDRVLGDDPATILADLREAIRAGASLADLGKVLAYAAALRVARFGTANEHSDWETAHHAFTYANAVHRVLERIGTDDQGETGDPEALRGVFHGAMAVYLARYLNVPPARLPGEAGDRLDDLPTDGQELRAALLDAFDRRHQVDAAGRLVARYLTLGHPAEELIATLARALLREDAGFHACQMLEAAVRQYRGWVGTDQGRHVLVAAARYLAAHSPTARTTCQTTDIARRLMSGGRLHEEAGPAPSAAADAAAAG